MRPAVVPAGGGSATVAAVEEAALIIGIGALIIGLVGTYVVHLEAQRANTTADEALEVSKQALDIEEERRWEELTPEFEASFISGDELLQLECHEHLNYSDVTFDIIEHRDQPISGLTVSEFDNPIPKGNLGPFDHGQVRTFPATRTEQGSGTLRLRLQCYGIHNGKQRSWEITVHCEIPGVPSATWM